MQPSTQFVEKNAMFLVSIGLAFVHSGDRDWGSDSPVNDELSTYAKNNHNFSWTLLQYLEQ